MKHTRTMVAVLACLCALTTATAKKPRKMKKAELLEIKESISSVNERLPVPVFLANGEKATNYCAGILGKTDEQYAADTLQAETFVNGMMALIGHYDRVPPEQAREYDMEGWQPYLWKRLTDVAERYAPLKKYCDNRREEARKARLQTMPEGRLLSFRYEEWGSSRPDPVSISIEPGDNGKLKLRATTSRRHDDGETPAATMAASDALIEEFRERVEAAETYKLLHHYAIPYLFPDFPIPTGGGPSWSFEARFEGGTIRTGGEDGPVGSCLDVATWLMQQLEQQPATATSKTTN